MSGGWSMLFHSEVSVPLLRGKGHVLHSSMSKQFYIQHRTFLKELIFLHYCHYNVFLNWRSHKMVFTSERHRPLLHGYLKLTAWWKLNPSSTIWWSFQWALPTRLQTLCRCILQNRKTSNVLGMYQKLVCWNVTNNSKFTAGRAGKLFPSQNECFTCNSETT